MRYLPSSPLPQCLWLDAEIHLLNEFLLDVKPCIIMSSFIPVGETEQNPLTIFSEMFVVFDNHVNMVLVMNIFLPLMA